MWNSQPTRNIFTDHFVPNSYLTLRPSNHFAELISQPAFLWFHFPSSLLQTLIKGNVPVEFLDMHHTTDCSYGSEPAIHLHSELLI
jgi:hypothetical protein